MKETASLFCILRYVKTMLIAKEEWLKELHSFNRKFVLKGTKFAH